MMKTFITERDIEDMVHRGTLELKLDDNTVLTDLAYEKANRVGLKLLQINDQPPASPIRPYLSQPHVEVEIPPRAYIADSSKSSEQPCGACMHPADPVNGDLKRRVTEAVTNRLGGQVDVNLLATIVERVFADLGVK